MQLKAYFFIVYNLVSCLSAQSEVKLPQDEALNHYLAKTQYLEHFLT